LAWHIFYLVKELATSEQGYDAKPIEGLARLTTRNGPAPRCRRKMRELPFPLRTIIFRLSRRICGCVIERQIGY
jgi:hypothetical protein